MIRVTVELVSARDSSRDRLLGVAHICRLDRGVYHGRLSKWAPKTSEQWKAGRVGIPDDHLDQGVLEGTIVGFDDVHRGAWDLLFLALRAIVGARNP